MSLIPNAERAIIEPAKLRDYLLSNTHPVGRFKARFFAGLGYSPDRWRRLDEDLRLQHLRAAVERVDATPYGRKHVIRAMLRGPNGQSAEVVSVWLVPTGTDTPRFVTAFPGVKL